MNLTAVLRRLSPCGLVLSLSLLAEVPAPPPVVRSATNLPPLPLPSTVLRPTRLRTDQALGTTVVAATNPFAARRVITATNTAAMRLPPVVNNPNALAWDAKLKEYAAKRGETDAKFTFALTNVSKESVTINSVGTSCGCTAAKLPQQPWVLAPGDHGEIGVTVDMRVKFGTITKTATISSSVGQIPLTVRCVIPQPDLTAMRAGDRSRNLQIAAADRQAVFRNDCASCHVAPTLGKTGKALYDTACGICHEDEHRASMVPGLRALNKPTDSAYWTQWITSGREGSLMPAFALKQGGILSDDQIKSLVDYLESDFKLEVKLPGTGVALPIGTPVKAGPLAP